MVWANRAYYVLLKNDDGDVKDDDNGNVYNHDVFDNKDNVHDNCDKNNKINNIFIHNSTNDN